MKNNIIDNIGIQFNSYVVPKVEPLIGRKWILNGEYNSFYNYIKDRYQGSPTNAGIINAYSAYIYGEGLIDEKTGLPPTFISKNDVRLSCLDYYTYGGYAVQVIWNMARTEPVLLKYTPIFKYGLNQNNKGDIDGYWYCYDWCKTWKYKPQFFKKFTGKYTGNDVEVLIIQRPSSNNYFSNPAYTSGLQYAHIEEELSNSSINHILNGFSAGKVINVFNATGEISDELKKEYSDKIKEKLTGSSNTNKVIVSVNDSVDSKITVDSIEIPQLNENYVYFSEEAKKQLFSSHSVTSPALFGIRDGGGLGNNSEELQTARREIYRMVINPSRDVIIDGFNQIINNKKTYDLKFKDFIDFEFTKSN